LHPDIFCIIGSCFAVPTQAPYNFTLVQVKDSTTALLSWNPVPAETVRGHFKGYKVSLYVHMHSYHTFSGYVLYPLMKIMGVGCVHTFEVYICSEHIHCSFE
jgi:hypothetical protein